MSSFSLFGMSASHSIVRKIGFFFLMLPLTMYVLIVVSFAISMVCTAIPIIAAFVLCFLIINTGKETIKTKILSTAIILTMVVLTIIIASYFYDYSWDGQWYHAATIKLLHEGWNPFYKPILNASDMPAPSIITTDIWVSHYTKGVETVEAGIVALTGNLESGKALNLWLLISLACLCWDFLDNFEKLRNKTTRALLTAVCICNPVLINQLMTYYIDYTGYTFIVIGIISIYQLCIREDKAFMWLLLLMGFFVPAIKFNIAFWFVFILLAFVGLIYILKKKFEFKLIRNMALTIAAGFIIGAFNPYVTNFYKKGNPLYPLLGEEKIDIMTDQTPDVIVGKNRIYQVHYSLLANPYNEMKQEHDVNFFQLDKYNFLSNGSTDTRLGGFGVFFFEALCILLVAFFFMKKEKWWKIILVSIIFLYLCLFLLPSGFWARYVPFFYIVVCLLSGYILSASKAKIPHIAAYAAMFLLLIDGLISIAGVGRISISTTIKDRYIINVMKQTDATPIYVNTWSVLLCDKLKHAKCPIETNTHNPTTDFISIPGVGLRFNTSLSINDFEKVEMPWLIRIGLFHFNVENIKDDEL